MTNPLDVDEKSMEAAPDVSEEPNADAQGGIEGRSLGQIAFSRLKRDRVAMAGLAVVLLLVIVAIAAPLLVKINGHPPAEFHQDQLDAALGGKPKGSFGGISGDFWFGVEPGSGRDIFSRIVYGARISLFIAIVATSVSVTIGVVMGMTAGYFGGWVDGAISRLMDILLAFPVLLFSIALIGILPDAGSASRIGLLVAIIGLFSWPYVGRIIRGQTLSLREREFIDAARSLGASNGHIIFRQVLPNLWAPILVYGTLIIPTNILFEAALSFLGVGVKPPTSSWGNMLSTATSWYATDPTYVAVPGLALFITVLAFNLFGDGLRDALDPRAGR